MKKSTLFLVLVVSLIYVVSAPPRQGKTFYVTYKMMEILKKGKEKVFSNYPIIFEWLSYRERFKNIFRYLLRKPLKKSKIFSSFMWKKEYMGDPIYDSSIVIDEAYREGVSSREWKDFSIQQHTWFATNGHNLNDIWLIAQNPARVDTIIREMTNYFIFVKKKYFLWTIFLWFVIEYHTDDANKKMNREPYFRERLTLRKDVMKAYDTHYFRDHKEPKLYSTWYDQLLRIQAKNLECTNVQS